MKHRTFSSEGCADAMVAAAYEDEAEGDPQGNATAGIEIGQLRAALQFYAKPENWKQTYIASRGFSVSETLCDGGRKARAALGLAE